LIPILSNSFNPQKTAIEPMTLEPNLPAPAPEDRPAFYPKPEANCWRRFPKNRMAGELRFAATKRTYQWPCKASSPFTPSKTPRNVIRSVKPLDRVGASTDSDRREPRTVQNRLAAVSSLFKASLRATSRHAQPDHGNHAPKVNNNRVDAAVLTREQVRSLLTRQSARSSKGYATRDPPRALYTGCRVTK